MLIAFTGLSGAGKSTAIACLEKCDVGERYYVGSVLHEEIRRRQLPLTPDNERLVREELRAEFGMAVFAERAVPHLLDRCKFGTVLLDAIYCPSERECYRKYFGRRLMIVAVTASFEIRCARLRHRPDRPLPYDNVVSRDAFEREKLRIDEVIADSDWQVANDGTLDELQQALNMLASSLS
jgi:dephospho-CoA kinase